MKLHCESTSDKSSDLFCFCGGGIHDVMHPAAVAGKGKPVFVFQTLNQRSLRDQTQGGDEGVAGNILPHTAVQIHGCHTRYASFSMNFAYRHATAQRDGEGLHAAVKITCHPAIMILPFENGDYMFAS